jgi:hypothetical protein
MKSRNGIGGRWARAVLAVALIAAGALYVLAPMEAAGAEAEGWKECVDEAFLGYNKCLMSASGWFEHKLCDLDWELEVAYCSAKAVGDIRNAWNGKS